MPRFRILRHDSPRGVHYDLLLETATLLVTFALDHEPFPGTSGKAEPLPDHRRIYLEYEGHISGDRGTVSEWDSGTYLLVRRSDTRLEIRVEGRTVKGRIVLEAIDPNCSEWSYRVI
ncbi:MAG: DNA polymerase ligase N-terminal domain-containing protein [Thermogutta sp.]